MYSESPSQPDFESLSDLTDARYELSAINGRWKDTARWWEECVQEKGLVLVSEVELRNKEGIDRKILLKEYVVSFDA